MTCELCDLTKRNDIKTKLYYRDSRVIIADCLTCGTPMLVFATHGFIGAEDRRHAKNIIGSLFKYDSIREEPRKTPQHQHWHIIGAELR